MIHVLLIILLIILISCTSRNHMHVILVCVANGQSLAIHCVGSSKWYTLYSLHIKKLTFSFQVFKRQCVVFEFIAYKCYVKSQVSKLTLLEGYLDSSDLYFFPQLIVKPSRSRSLSHSSSFSLHKSVSSISCSTINKPIISSLWHYKLGHAHFPTMNIALKYNNIYVSNKGANLFCKSSCLEKSHRIHAPLSYTEYIYPFKIIHTDIQGLAPHPSSSSFSYYITFVDAYTKYTWIYLLHQKSEALHTFKFFLCFVKTQF